MNTPAFIVTDNSVTVILDGKPYTMDSSHRNFREVTLALSEERYDCLLDLFDTTQAVLSYVDGNVEIRDGEVIYRGETIHNHVTERLLTFMAEGLPFKPLLNFLDKLMANPSRRAVNELYTFLEHKNMPLTPDGNFLAYKSVRQDWTDHHTGKFSNTVGSVLGMTRNTVCDDANIGCSNGFHAGSLAYAQSFGGSGSRLLIVEIDPADVVSVPLDCDCQKLRTAKYKVVGTFERALDESLNDDYYEGNDDLEEEFDDELDDYDAGYEAGLRAFGEKVEAEKKKCCGGGCHTPPANMHTERDEFGRFCKK